MMAKAPNPKAVGAASRAQEARDRARRFNEQKYVVHVDDRSWDFVVGDVTGQHVIDLRLALKSDDVDPVVSALHLVNYFEDYPPLDALVSMVYLARLQAGERMSFADVAGGLTKGNAVWVDLPEDAIVPETEVVFLDPPASSGS